MGDHIGITSFINAFTSGASGADVRFVEIFKRADGFDLRVITPEQGKTFCQDRGLKADYVTTTSENDKENVLFLYSLRTYQAFRKNDNRSGKKIQYCTSDFIPDVLPAFLNRQGRLSHVQLIHHLIPSPLTRAGNRFTNIISYAMQRASFVLIKISANKIIVVSPLMRNKLIDMGFDARTISVNPNGVDVHYYRGLPPSTGEYDAAFLGRLHVSKGVHDLINIWRRVCDERPEARLAVIGGGNPDLLESLKQEAKEKGLANNINFLGYQERDDAFGIIKGSKMFLFPSHEEGFGMAPLEAMACDLPVIAWDLPAYKYAFEGGGMIELPRGDIEGFSHTALELLNDAEKRKALSEKSHRLVEKYDWGIITKREIELIIESLGHGNR